MGEGGEAELSELASRYAELEDYFVALEGEVRVSEREDLSSYSEANRRKSRMAGKVMSKTTPA